MLTDEKQNELTANGIILRGGVILDEDDLLDIIDSASYVEDHPRPGHFYVGMGEWEVIRKGYHGSNQYRAPGARSTPSIHAALLPDNRWLLWSSKTEDSPAYFEVRYPKPTP